MSGFPSVQSQLIAVELYSKHTFPCKASVATVVVALQPDASVGIEACEKNCQAGNKKKQKKTRKHSFTDRIVVQADSPKVRDSDDKNEGTKARYLNNGMSRLDTKSRIAPFLGMISFREGNGAYTGKLCRTVSITVSLTSLSLPNHIGSVRTIQSSRKPTYT